MEPIRPSIELHSFHVECQFNETEGLTVLRPIDWRKSGYNFSANESERCRNADCYTKKIQYGANISQIKVITLRFSRDSITRIGILVLSKLFFICHTTFCL